MYIVTKSYWLFTKNNIRLMYARLSSLCSKDHFILVISILRIFFCAAKCFLLTFFCLQGEFMFIDNGPYLNSLEHVIEHYSLMSDGLPTTLQHAVPPRPRPPVPDIPPQGVRICINTAIQILFKRNTHILFTNACEKRVVKYCLVQCETANTLKGRLSSVFGNGKT